MSGGARLEGVGITKRFGGLTAVDDMHITAEPGRVTALIGPNGAGKTTLFACLTGMERPDTGTVLLDGRDITAATSDERARLGIARTFQRLNVFATMTVRDNLLVGAEGRTAGSLIRGTLGLPEPTRTADRRRVREVLHQLRLRGVQDTPAGALPTGTLRLVELGRALCTDPKVLLLDEPASGLDSRETQELQGVLRDVAATGVAVLLVEHDVDLVFEAADDVYAMAQGRLLAQGAAESVRSNDRVQDVYLGQVGQQ